MDEFPEYERSIDDIGEVSETKVISAKCERLKAGLYSLCWAIVEEQYCAQNGMAGPISNRLAQKIDLLWESLRANIITENSGLPGFENPHYQLSEIGPNDYDPFELVYKDPEYSRYGLVPVNQSKNRPFSFRLSQKNTGNNGQNSQRENRLPQNGKRPPRSDPTNKSLREIATLFGGSTLLTDALYQIYLISESTETPTPDARFLTVEFSAAILLLVYGEYKRWKNDDDFSIDKWMLVLTGVFQALGINSSDYFETGTLIAMISMIANYFKNEDETLNDN